MRRKIIWLVISCIIVVVLLLASCIPAPSEVEDGTPAGEETTNGAEEETTNGTEAPTLTGPPPSLIDATMAIRVNSSGNTPIPGKSASVFEDDISTIYGCAELVDARPNTEIKAEWIYITGEHPDLQNNILYQNSLIESESVPFSFSQDRPSSGWPVGDYEIRLYLNGELDKIASFSIVEAPKILIDYFHGWVSGSSYTFEGRVKNVGTTTLQSVSIELSFYDYAPRGIPYEVQSIPLYPSTISVGEKASFSYKFQESKYIAYSYKFLSPTGKEVPYTETEERSALDELFVTIENGDEVRVESILKTQEALLNVVGQGGEYALHIAVWEGHKEIAEFLIDKGADVNVTDSYGWTPLHLAIYKQLDETPEISQQKQEIVELLINKGADVNARTNSQLTPLHAAAYEGFLGTVSLLIDEGADVNATDKYKYTPLHEAVYNGYEEIAALLIANGANVDAQTKYRKYTPLHWAAVLGYTEIVELLIANGADVNVLDWARHTPLHRAIHNGHEEIAEILRQNGGIDK